MHYEGASKRPNYAITGAFPHIWTEQTETKMSVKDKEATLNSPVIYRINITQLENLRAQLDDNLFENIPLKSEEYHNFQLTFYRVKKESSHKLVRVLKPIIINVLDTYTWDEFILIAVCTERNSAFAICTGKTYYHIFSYIDLNFAFPVAKKILDPESIRHLKRRFLSGEVICDDIKLHGSKNNAILVSNLVKEFCIIDGLQAKIADSIPETCSLLHQLRSTVTVKRRSLKFGTSLSLKEVLALMYDLSNLQQSEDAKWNFLDSVTPITESKLCSDLDIRLEEELQKKENIDEKGFFVCPRNYNKWMECQKVHLFETQKEFENVQSSNAERKTSKKWDSKPLISDVLDVIETKNNNYRKLRISSFKMKFKVKGIWQTPDLLINYIQGHIIYKDKCYFHIGPNWYIINANNISDMEKEFFQVLKRNLMSEEDDGSLPLPWCNKDEDTYISRSNQAKECSKTCARLLYSPSSAKYKSSSRDTEIKIENIFPIEVIKRNEFSESGAPGQAQSNCDTPSISDQGKKKSDRSKQNKCTVPDDKKNELSKIIGKSICNLYIQSLLPRNEGEYNEAYFSDFFRTTKGNGKFPPFLVGDRVLVKGVELFDIMKITEERLYLYHVKDRFGQTTRDAVSQIRVSASLVHNAIYADGEDVLELWYNAIIQYRREDITRKEMKKYLMEKEVTKEEFKKLFQKTIVYVYAFLDESKERKQYSELVSDDRSHLVQMKDLYKALNATKDKTKSENVDQLCSQLEQDGIISKKMNDSCEVGKQFMNTKSMCLVSTVKGANFSDDEANQLLKTLDKHFIKTVEINSYIAKFELVRLEQEFRQKYPHFKLQFCQIKNPWK